MKTLHDFMAKVARREASASDFNKAHALVDAMFEETAAYFRGKSDEFNKPRRAGKGVFAAPANAAKIGGIEKSLPTEDRACRTGP